MRKFGLIGYPLTHSFSKKYFTEKFSREQIGGCEYELYSIESIAQLPELLKQHPDLEGLNVTIPYKKLVIPFLSNASAAVMEMQACNCITIKNEKLFGNNTDVTGFAKTFTPHLKSSHKKALILGTGGASSAVAYTLRQLGINYLFVSRNKGNTNKVIDYKAVNEELLIEYTVIINTTPLGTFPDVESLPELPYQFITPNHYLYDLVYNPPLTSFLKKGKEQGAITENGSEMLVIQAEESWKIWNDS